MVIISHIFTSSNGQYNHSNIYEIFNKSNRKILVHYQLFECDANFKIMYENIRLKTF